jgi:2-polyprenyl-3-methyl-5-hydroxy-6-metoxy-1,4-benzoquinol methylase
MAPEIASRVESAFANALNYDAYRPSYPQESVDNLLGALRVLGLPKARILDLAAGTGKLTEQLVAKAEGYDIVAVDPHPQMLEVLVRKRLPRVRAIKGTSSNMAVIELRVGGQMLL